ncbi:hypothetical protein [Egbenema bharatensis]|uniref:hypothetical protein n=1 Tax=Egbenema bharatensis TaxID=3463334 RepID=UPI003A89D70A
MTGIVGLFQGNQSSRDTGTANELMNAAQQTDIVSTAKPVTKYRNIEDGEVKQAEEQLKREQKWTKNWAKFLQLNLRHQQLDTQRTQDWAQWRVGTTNELANKALIIAKQGSQQAVIAAKYASGVQTIGAQTQAQIGLIQAGTQSRIQQIQQRANEARSKLQSRGGGDR